MKIRSTVVVTTLADGSATAFSDTITGSLSTIIYTKNNFSNGAVLLITAESTGEVLWSQTSVNATATIAPRQPVSTTLGAAALYAAGGTAILDKIVLINDRAKIVLTGAGNVTTGTYNFTFE